MVFDKSGPRSVRSAERTRADFSEAGMVEHDRWDSAANGGSDLRRGWRSEDWRAADWRRLDYQSARDDGGVGAGATGRPVMIKSCGKDTRGGEEVARYSGRGRQGRFPRKRRDCR